MQTIFYTFVIPIDNDNINNNDVDSDDNVMFRKLFAATNNLNDYVANGLHYLSSNINMGTKEVTKKDRFGTPYTQDVFFPNDGSNHPRIGDKWFNKYYDRSPHYVKTVFKYIMSYLPYGTNLIKLDRKVIGCWNKDEKPLDAAAISKAIKWLKGDGERPEVIYRPTDDTTVIFNAKGNEKDYYFVNPSVIFNGSYNDLVYDYCKIKNISIEEYKSQTCNDLNYESIK